MCYIIYKNNTSFFPFYLFYLSSSCLLYEKRKKKQRVEQLAESQRGAINKFFVSDKQVEQSVEDLENDEFETLVNNEYENLMDEQGNRDIGSGEANQDDEINVECDHSNINYQGN